MMVTISLYFGLHDNFLTMATFNKQQRKWAFIYKTCPRGLFITRNNASMINMLKLLASAL